MDFDQFNPEEFFHSLWNQIQIARDVEYSLFTFGDSDLPYYLVMEPAEKNELVSLRKGEIKVTRPMIITPDTDRPEFQNFFEDNEGEEMVNFLLSRTAAFSNLRLSNQSGPDEIVSDSSEEVVARLNAQLDDEEEDHVAILVAPTELAGFALLRYATERIMQSAPGNLQELRERGFLP